MKKLLVLFACVLFLGCDYSVPLVPTPNIEIDRSVLGLWQTTNDGATTQLLVLPLDKNEYLVSYPAGTNDGMFAQGCLCRAADKTLVQLKWIGTGDGKLPDDNRVFQFLSYTLTSDKLTVRLLNTDVVSKDVASTEELTRSIAANKDKTNLFGEPVIFIKVSK